MKILNSSVSMAATSKHTQSTVKKMNLQYWVGDKEPGNMRSSSSTNQDMATISALSRKLSLQASLSAAAKPASGASGTSGDTTDGLSDKDKRTIQILDEFLYRLTGKHFKFKYIDMSKISRNAQQLQMPSGANQASVQTQKAGYGLIYDSTETHTEQQAMSFQAAGSVQTADGRAIDFNVQLSMSSQFQSTNEVHIKAGDAKVDPLVINLDGAAPQLSQRDFSFDIDNDGDEEQISKLASGSGFLALDKNGDGQINNGGELFGPTKGNGFAELKTYDTDGNNWIDENDAVYDKLRIWEADDQGNMQLFALGQKGVGAIYLGNVASSFDLNDSQNNSLGTVQSTGIYLKEDGGAGTIQHIDLTV